MARTPPRPQNAASPLLALATSPVYVDYITEETRGPESGFFTALRPEHRRSWADIREVGGAAWKFACYWAKKPGGRALFVTRVSAPTTAADDGSWQGRAFLDDGRWLEWKIKKQQSDIGPSLEPVLLRARREVDVDYAFHLPDPEHDQRPMFSIDRGAGREVEWQDLLEEWSKRSSAIGEDIGVVVFLGGVLRTQLIDTLFDAITTRCPQTIALLARSRLVIDFGRTDYRSKQDIEKRSREQILRCVKEADTAIVDSTTASVLDLLRPESLPKRELIVRPHGFRKGVWQIYRRAAGVDRLERSEFPAPEPPSKQGDERVDRPHRVAELVWRLQRGEPLDGAGPWEPHIAPLEFTDSDQITTDPALKTALDRIRFRAEQDPEFTRLLISGPTGSGKEIIAQWLHRIHPTRRHASFVAVSASRLDGGLVDSELFGHVERAFNEARYRKGAFLAADDGVLLIDDLDALPLQTQAKLLRVIEGRSVKHVGADDSVRVNTLVIATTNVPPDELVARGKLRADLYYRFRANEWLELAPLKERRRDAVRAARAIWERRNRTFGTSYPWPNALDAWFRKAELNGNFRTVEAVVESVHKEARALGESGEVVDASLELPVNLDRLDGPAEPSARGNAIDSFVSAFAELVRNLGVPPAAAAPPPSTPRPPSAPASEMARHMTATCEAAGIDRLPTMVERFGRFVEIWSTEAHGLHAEAASLSRQEIMDCLRIEPRERNRLQALLREEHRVRTVGKGRGARWRPAQAAPVGSAPWPTL